MKKIRTFYGSTFPLLPNQEKEIKDTVSIVSDKLSIRNPNRLEFLKDLQEFLEKY